MTGAVFYIVPHFSKIGQPATALALITRFNYFEYTTLPCAPLQDLWAFAVRAKRSLDYLCALKGIVHSQTFYYPEILLLKA